jgi:predicted dehydrogenase
VLKNSLNTQPILVIGAGSIGERHIRNLWKLGFENISVFRQRNLPFRDIANACVNTIHNWTDVVKFRPYATIIASPTSFHLHQAIDCANIGSHILVEKPLSHNLVDLEKLNEVVIRNNIYLRVAYMMRFHPLVIKLKNIITNKELGNLVSFIDKWGDFLPDWHPWEDYRLSYAAKKELGGGAALTLSHDIDLVNWLVDSNISNFYSFKNYKSNLEIEVESGFDLVLKYSNGVTGSVHLSYYEKVPEKFIKLVFDNGSISLDFITSKLIIKKPNSENEFLSTSKKFERNDLFLDELKYFFLSINNFNIKDSIKQINESIEIIKICNFE